MKRLLFRLLLSCLRRYFFLPALFIVSLNVSGQVQDFRSWWSADFSKEVTDELEISLDLGQRFRNNSLRYDKSLITAGVEYELFKDFTIEGGYRYIVLKDDRLSWSSRYRVNADAAYDLDLEKFTLQLRERIQYGFDDLNSLDDYGRNKLTNRNRLKAEYDIFGSPVTVFGLGEFFVDLNEHPAFLPSGYRVEAGAQVMLSFTSDLEISYMMDHELNDSNPLTAHVIVVSFSYKL